MLELWHRHADAAAEPADHQERHPQQRQAGEEELRAPHRRDHHRHADVGLGQQQADDDAVEHDAQVAGSEPRAPISRAGAADRDDDDGDDNALWAGASPQLIRALKTARTAAPVQAPPAAPVAPAPDKSERNAAPLAYASSKESEAKAEPPKPPAPAVPPPTPTPAPPGTRREPDGPVQVAGMAWPWAKGRSPFARRGRRRGPPG